MSNLRPACVPGELPELAPNAVCHVTRARTGRFYQEVRFRAHPLTSFVWMTSSE